MDIGLRAAAVRGRPPDQLIRSFDDDHAALVRSQVEGLLNVGWMHLGRAIVRDLASGDQCGDGFNIGPGRGTRRQAQSLRKDHRLMVRARLAKPSREGRAGLPALGPG